MARTSRVSVRSEHETKTFLVGRWCYGCREKFARLPERPPMEEPEIQEPTFVNARKRSCDGCTACCEGWLTAEVHGKYMYSGRMCHFKGKGQCTIYDQRPGLCSAFRCEWLANNDIPEWLKPDLSHTIMYRRMIGEIEYINVMETGVKIDSTILNWIVLHALQNGLNIRYMVNGGWNFIGSTEFLAAITE